MRTFAQKPKAAQRTSSAKPMIPGRARLGQSREVPSLLHSQGTIGNQAVQRLPEANTEDVKEDGSSTAEIPRFGYDFSRIPVFAPVRVQTKLSVSTPGDIYEQEADRVADQVMRMPEPQVQRQPEEEEELQLKTEPAVLQRQEMEEEEEKEVLQAKFTTSETPAQLQGDVGETANRTGMPGPLQAGLEALSGIDLSGIRVHTNSSKPAQLNALAYTQGQDVYIGPGQEKHLPHEGWHAVQQMQGRVNPTMQAKGVPINNDAGLEREADVMGAKALQKMHVSTTSRNAKVPDTYSRSELTHVVQHSHQIAPATVQRQCSDPDFCKPFATAAEATSEEAWLRTYFLPAMDLKFGTEVHDLWESYLSRTPGASLARTVFDTAGNPIEDSFATSGDVEDDQEAVLDLVVSRLSRLPGGTLRPHTTTMVSLTNFLSASEMNNRPINFSNPLAKAGNIAGDIGSSAAGPDFRKIARANVVLRKVPVIGNSGYIYFELVPHYEVYDAVDLCPGQCGSAAEQFFTVPLSRLEVMGRAFDVPYVVKFQPEPETRREWYASLPL